MFSCEFCEIFKNKLFIEHLRVGAPTPPGQEVGKGRLLRRMISFTKILWYSIVLKFCDLSINFSGEILGKFLKILCTIFADM